MTSATDETSLVVNPVLLSDLLGLEHTSSTFGTRQGLVGRLDDRRVSKQSW